MAKKKFDSFEKIPTSDEANERWREFMFRLDDLNLSICELSELAQLILLALKENAEQARNPLATWIQKVVEKFYETREDYNKRRSELRAEQGL